MIIRSMIYGGYVWIEYDNSVDLEDRIFVLHTSAPGHASFAMGAALARTVAELLTNLTERPAPPPRGLWARLRAWWNS